MTGPLAGLVSQIGYFLSILGIIVLLLFVFFCLFYGLVLFLRHSRREEKSLGYTLLQVALPAGNEIKIDAAEQMFASFYSIKKGGWLNFFKTQPYLSFEIVAKHEDIRFYVAVPGKLRDMVEKQIHGAYPDAEITEVPEHNIFSEDGKVAFAELEMRSSAYLPIKVYKDLPTDPLSALTAGLAKMGKKEGAAIQILVSPADNKWRGQGRIPLLYEDF